MTKQTELFNGFPLPKSNEQEVLLTLILQGNVSIMDFPYLSGFRTRVSQLKANYGLILETKTESKTNKFGNKFKYSVHILPESQKDFATDLYRSLNQKSK
jgi:hypothetical protein